MSLVFDVTADQLTPQGRQAVQELAAEEIASLAEELVAYHQHFAPLFYRQEQREWAAIYLRGLLTADVALSSNSLGRVSGTMTRSWPSISAW
jgi:hypothetical protein